MAGQKTLRDNKLPDGVRPYKRTPVFDQDSLPSALRNNHRTKPGVWGVIHVLEGRLAYFSLTPRIHRILEPDTPGIVQPGEVHKVEPVGMVKFFVEFHRSVSSA